MTMAGKRKTVKLVDVAQFVVLGDGETHCSIEECRIVSIPISEIDDDVDIDSLIKDNYANGVKLSSLVK